MHYMGECDNCLCPLAYMYLVVYTTFESLPSAETKFVIFLQKLMIELLLSMIPLLN